MRFLFLGLLTVAPLGWAGGGQEDAMSSGPSLQCEPGAGYDKVQDLDDLLARLSFDRTQIKRQGIRLGSQ